MTLSLIPSGQPQGDRQTNEAAADAAGLQKKLPQQAPTDLNLAPPVRQATPREAGEFDALESRTPQSFGQLRQAQDSRTVQAMEVSNSPALRDIARRLRGF